MMIDIPNRGKLAIAAFAILYTLSRAWADGGLENQNSQNAVITRTEGNVVLFSHPSKTLPKEKHQETARAKFENEYFQVRKAHPGDPLQNGNILRTSPNSKALLIYPNGDQIHVGPATTYRVRWKEKKKNREPASVEMDLSYGQLRGIIQKNGPRSRLRVKSKTAVMGVRGTDFFIESHPSRNFKTEVSVIRGQVEVTSHLAPKSPILVAKGHTAGVEKNSQQENPSDQAHETREVTLTPTTKEKLLSLLQESEVSFSAEKRNSLTPETQTVIAKLENQAKILVLRETADPGRQLASPSTQTLDQLNRIPVEKTIETAPHAEEKIKLRKKDLKELNQNPYEKYFESKNVDTDQ